MTWDTLLSRASGSAMSGKPRKPSVRAGARPVARSSADPVLRRCAGCWKGLWCMPVAPSVCWHFCHLVGCVGRLPPFSTGPFIAHSDIDQICRPPAAPNFLTHAGTAVREGGGSENYPAVAPAWQDSSWSMWHNAHPGVVVNAPAVLRGRDKSRLPPSAGLPVRGPMELFFFVFFFSSQGVEFGLQASRLTDSRQGFTYAAPVAPDIEPACLVAFSIVWLFGNRVRVQAVVL